MKNGSKLISQEREEQITKHGFGVTEDRYYNQNELIKAALFCINSEVFECPFHWDENFRNKILLKSRIDQLAVAGALIAAEIDRIQHSITNLSNQ